MVDQSPSPELLRNAIEAHLAPNVHLQSLPRALELLAHIALLADKLQQEIVRVLQSDASVDDSEHAKLSEKASMRLRTYAAEAERASRRLWQISVDLRLNHIAAVLSTGKKVSIKILYLIECYFPAPQIKDEPSSSRKTYKSSKLFIRAMPGHIAQEYEEAGRISREWYASASESSTVSEEQARLLRSKREDEALLAKQALAYTSRVIGYIQKVEKTLAGDSGPTPAKMEIKEEIKRETRDSRSPSPNQLAKTRRLIFTKRPQSSSRTSLNRSITPKVPAPLALGSDVTTSMAEAEAILTIPKVEEPSSALTPRVDKRRMEGEAKPILDPTKPKKRPRPSFPPREGPDYTRPLPHAPPKKLKTFGLGDLKR